MRLPLTHSANVFMDDVNSAVKSASPAKVTLFSYAPFFEANPSKTNGAFTKSCKILESSIRSKFLTDPNGECSFTRNSHEEVYTFTTSDILVAGSTLGTLKAE